MALGLLLGGASVAQLFLAPYPAPGGNSYANDGGHAARAGGLMNYFTNFDPTASDKLYFAMGQWSPTFMPDGPQCYTDGTPDTLTFDAAESNFSAGIVVWTGSTTLTWNPTTFFRDDVISTRFTQSVTTLIDVPLALTPATSIPGMPPAVGGVLEVTGDFKSHWLLEVQAPDTGTYEPAYDMFDRLLTQGEIFYNVGGGFYYTFPEGVLIFIDGFETGNVSAWSSSVP